MPGSIAVSQSWVLGVAIAATPTPAYYALVRRHGRAKTTGWNDGFQVLLWFFSQLYFRVAASLVPRVPGSIVVSQS